MLRNFDVKNRFEHPVYIARWQFYSPRETEKIGQHLWPAGYYFILVTADLLIDSREKSCKPLCSLPLEFSRGDFSPSLSFERGQRIIRRNCRVLRLDRLWSNCPMMPTSLGRIIFQPRLLSASRSKWAATCLPILECCVNIQKTRRKKKQNAKKSKEKSRIIVFCMFPMKIYFQKFVSRKIVGEFYRRKGDRGKTFDKILEEIGVVANYRYE